MSGAAYYVRADRGRYAKAFREGDYAAIGWEKIGDLSDVPRGDMEALTVVYDAAYPDHGKMRRVINLGQLRRFVWEIEAADVVVTPKEDSAYLLVGVVAGDYYYAANAADGCPYRHRREVRWLEKLVQRSPLPVPIQNSLRAFLTVFGVRSPDELLGIAGVQVPESVGRVEKGISELVLERLLELDADEFEVLVAELLTALGFEAQKVGRSGDGGVDVEGALDVYGLASVDLKVQVKRYKVGNLVGHEVVERFRASVPEKSQAAFVTTSSYTKKAREEAQREGYKRVGLMDGEQLVGVLDRQYEQLPEELRGRLGLRRALVVDRLVRDGEAM